MIYLKKEEEVALIKEGGDILSKAQGVVAENIKIGVTTSHLDVLAETFIKDSGAVPSFKGYQGFPNSICVSVNEQVVHGIPSSYQLKSGDIVSIDCGVYFKGFHSDMAFTYPVGDVSDEKLRLLKVTKKALFLGIEVSILGNRVGDISLAIYEYATKHRCGVVRELTGHGVGSNLHEEPAIPNYGKRGSGIKLKEGMVIAIEPMLNLGDHHILNEEDGWTISTLDKKPSAHFEHTIAVMPNGPEVLTTYKYIEKFFKF